MINNKYIIIGTIVTVFILALITAFVVTRNDKEQTTPSDQNRFPTQSTTDTRVRPTITNDNQPITLDNVTPQPEDFSDELKDTKEIEQFHKTEYPDVFLSNKVPYEDERFSITSRLVNEGDGYFAFTVHIKLADFEQGKQIVRAWIQSQGLTSEQIDKLVIIYE